MWQVTWSTLKGREYFGFDPVGYGQRRRDVGLANRREHNRENISVDPCGNILIAHASAYSLGNFRQNAVARFKPKAVIDQPELVDIHMEHRRLAPGSPFGLKKFRKALHGDAACGQSGECVGDTGLLAWPVPWVHRGFEQGLKGQQQREHETDDKKNSLGFDPVGDDEEQRQKTEQLELGKSLPYSRQVFCSALDRLSPGTYGETPDV